MFSRSLRTLVSLITLAALVLAAPAAYAGKGGPKADKGKKTTAPAKPGKTASGKTASKSSKKGDEKKTAAAKTSKSTAKTASAKSTAAKSSRTAKATKKGEETRGGRVAAKSSKKSDERKTASAKTSTRRSARSIADERLGTPKVKVERTHAAKVTRSTKQTRSTGKQHESESGTPERQFTARGNTKVTRNVALNLLAERAPDLAALLGIQAVERQDTVVAEREVPGGGLRNVKVIEASYIDAELDESEDPDHITPEDLARLEAQKSGDINTFYKEFTRYMASLNGDGGITDNGVDKQALLEGMMNWLGTRYLFGGMGRNGIDCSAFTGSVYRGLGYKLPRTAAMQWTNGQAIDRENLQFGDLIFFHTRKAVYVSHVGIYLGNGLFTHASSRNGVTISSLDSPYYSAHFIGGRRLDLSEITMNGMGGEDAGS